MLAKLGHLDSFVQALLAQWLTDRSHCLLVLQTNNHVVGAARAGSLRNLGDAPEPRPDVALSIIAPWAVIEGAMDYMPECLA